MAKILVVDDNRRMAEMIKFVLGADQYQVDIAQDGDTAVRTAKAWKPDLILLDVMMPGVSGLDVCRRLRRLEATSSTPIIMVTARIEVDDKIEGFEAGADDYITKPFNNDELKVRVESRLTRFRAAQPDEPPRRLGMTRVAVPLALKRHRSGIFRRGYRITKRLFDLVATVLALPFAVPIFAAIAAAIYIDSPGPILFVQKRTGMDGCVFNMYKFRTMVPNAEELKEKYLHLNELTWPDFKITNDPRMTRVGRFLRRTSLDELPQLFNILKGEMSIVGPRPTSFRASTYQLWQTERLEVIPGLTGLWQVKGRSDIDFVERVELDIEYIERQCWRLDLEIILRTVTAVLGGRGAH